MKLQVKPNLPFRVPEERQDRVNALSMSMTLALGLLVVAFSVAIELELIASARNAGLSPIMLPTVAVMSICILSCVGTYVVRMYRATK